MQPGLNAALNGQDPKAKPVERSPNIQDDVKRFVAAGMLMLYDDKAMKSAEKSLKDGMNTIEDMARIGNQIAFRIYSQAAEGGTQIDPEVVLTGGLQLMQEIGDFAREVGAEVSDEDIETAYVSAADKFRQMLLSKGLVTEEELADLATQIAELGDQEQIQGAAARVVENRKTGNKVRNAAPAEPAPEPEPEKKGMAQ